MSGHSFAKLVNAPYTRMKPNLCPFCVHCYYTNSLGRLSGFDYGCQKKQTLISSAHTEKGRCADFERADEPVLKQKDIEAEIESARSHQTYLKARKASRDPLPFDGPLQDDSYPSPRAQGDTEAGTHQQTLTLAEREMLESLSSKWRFFGSSLITHKLIPGTDVIEALIAKGLVSPYNRVEAHITSEGRAMLARIKADEEAGR